MGPGQHRLASEFRAIVQRLERNDGALAG
jgi:hypothetical protein